MNGKYTSALLSTLLLLPVSIPGTGQTPQVRNFSRYDYMGGSQNWQIAQGESGYLYFADNAGVLDYNGAEWTLHPALPGRSVRSLVYSPADSCVYYAESNVLKRFSVAPQSSFVEETLFEGASSGISEIWALEKTADGLFFRDENALFRWGDDGLKRYSFRGRVDAIGVIGGQMLVCVRGEGLMRYADKQFVCKIPLAILFSSCHI